MHNRTNADYPLKSINQAFSILRNFSATTKLKSKAYGPDKVQVSTPYVDVRWLGTNGDYVDLPVRTLTELFYFELRHYLNTTLQDADAGLAKCFELRYIGIIDPESTTNNFYLCNYTELARCYGYGKEALRKKLYRLRDKFAAALCEAELLEPLPEAKAANY